MTIKITFCIAYGVYLYSDLLFTIMDDIGKNIRTLRQKQNWSQGDVARRLGISIPAFSKIETGITDINISRLNQISKLFGLSVVEILSKQGESPFVINEEELIKCKARLTERDQDVISLQKKVIDLLDELRAGGDFVSLVSKK